MFAALGAGLLLLTGCDAVGGASGQSQDKDARQPVSRADERLPAGFELYVGQRGDVREVTAMSPDTGGTIVTYSVRARPQDVVAFYEAAATAKGMDMAGRVSAAELYGYDAHKDGGTPHSFGVVAISKGEFTNVSLSFDVTP